MSCGEILKDMCLCVFFSACHGMLLVTLFIRVLCSMSAVPTLARCQVPGFKWLRMGHRVIKVAPGHISQATG